MPETQETISLPTIVLNGDMGSRKSSVLEALSGISLPHRVLFPTRVPLKIRLQHHDDHHVPEFFLEYRDEKITIVEESKICEAIKKVTIEIAGEGQCIANIPLTLVVKQKGLPNVTLVELPRIARVSVEFKSFADLPIVAFQRKGFLYLLSLILLVVVVLVATLGPEFVLWFAPIKLSISQLVLASAPLG
nr:dynamin-related protein 4C-like [Tanacetum cinerariifolium]